MRVRVGCEFRYESAYPTPLIFLVRPRPRPTHRMITEVRLTEPYTPVEAYTDAFGNEAWRLIAPEGVLRLSYDALADVPPTSDPVLIELGGTLVQDLPPDVLGFLLPSRHCQSDMVLDEAWALFGQTLPGWTRVQAICDWIHTNVVYGKGSTANTSGYEAFQARRGVCRDFAHIAVMLCRAMTIPARYVCGYLPDINVTPDPTPMDFHAWFEAYVDGAWRTFDARHNRPRTGRVLIAEGRDAVDCALTTIYGSSYLQKMRVWADEVPDDTTLDGVDGERL